ncbi:oxidoreductase [Coccomyxa subellipsoidea C-169]|uniref:Oxidoreductase n=1 Tax=Coccomyxa subellipsoidea (strain C-169) TaxID=574566 RepID=I0YYB2_COCSC|nr:oxidoreductase [Coccomyxa subellipsoidea C-169]EIE23381.1 oxidoreductase [Coccomyxa subellipsoidea C-169]|eukprot:XP_005647925.1 oxidoreductase [Coccomyxa subellipsoidea C-169]
MPLGRSDLQVSKLGLGTLQWGDTQQGYGSRFSEDQLKEVFDTAVAGGVNFFDTAEIYGYQSMKEGSASEQILGRLAKSSDQRLVLGTKFFTVPWTNAIIKALRASLERLGIERVDLYQVHFPFPAYSQEVLAEGFAEAVDEGLVGAVGVCNYDVDQLKKFHSLMAARNISVVSNQVKYNIFERKVEETGLLQLCRDLGVTLVAHSPLRQGLLTGAHLSRCTCHVALAYLMGKGAIPIPGAKSVEQVKDHIGALQFSLDENEIAVIDERLQAFK